MSPKCTIWSECSHWSIFEFLCMTFQRYLIQSIQHIGHSLLSLLLNFTLVLKYTHTMQVRHITLDLESTSQGSCYKCVEQLVNLLSKPGWSSIAKAVATRWLHITNSNQRWTNCAQLGNHTHNNKSIAFAHSLLNSAELAAFGFIHDASKSQALVLVTSELLWVLTRSC